MYWRVLRKSPMESKLKLTLKTWKAAREMEQMNSQDFITWNNLNLKLKQSRIQQEFILLLDQENKLRLAVAVKPEERVKH